MLQKIIGYFNVIWDDAEELQRLALNSDPRVVIDTAGLSASATALANLLARRISSLDDGEIEALASLLDRPARRLEQRLQLGQLLVHQPAIIVFFRQFRGEALLDAAGILRLQGAGPFLRIADIVERRGQARIAEMSKPAIDL